MGNCAEVSLARCNLAVASSTSWNVCFSIRSSASWSVMPSICRRPSRMVLARLANTILDVRLQMLGMTDQEALDLMEKQTFQEVEEATAKLQRAKLTSAQLPMYYVGWRAWIKAREEYQRAKGSAFSLADFNDRALKEGAVPISVLSSLLK